MKLLSDDVITRLNLTSNEQCETCNTEKGKPPNSILKDAYVYSCDIICSYVVELTTRGYYVSVAPPSGWFHLTVRFHGEDGGVSVYHGGELRGTDTYSGTKSPAAAPGPGHLVLGRHYSDLDTGYGSVMVDELTLWDN